MKMFYPKSIWIHKPHLSEYVIALDKCHLSKKWQYTFQTKHFKLLIVGKISHICLQMPLQFFVL